MLPGALYELGAAVTVALSLAPQLVESVARVRAARRLRGANWSGGAGGRRSGTRGAGHSGAGPCGRRVGALRGIAVPVLHDALDWSLRLAAAMDARGYGRTGPASPAARRLTAGLMLTGLAGLCLGGYELLDPTVPHPIGLGGFAVGSILCVAGLALGGRRVSRSRYRPDPWRWPEWLVVASGITSAVVLSLNVGYDPAALNPGFHPLVWPTLPLLPAAAILVAAVAAVAAPPPEISAPSSSPAPAPAFDALPTGGELHDRIRPGRCPVRRRRRARR